MTITRKQFIFILNTIGYITLIVFDWHIAIGVFFIHWAIKYEMDWTDKSLYELIVGFIKPK